MRRSGCVRRGSTVMRRFSSRLASCSLLRAALTVPQQRLWWVGSRPGTWPSSSETKVRSPLTERSRGAFMTVPTAGVAIHARNVAVIQRNEGSVVFADRRLDEAVHHFDLDAPTRHFVGRASAFARIDAFAATHPCGYVEVVGEAGLGKTALAAEIAKRRAAIVFLASISAGTRRPQQFLEHVCSELIIRYGLERAALPGNLDSNVLLSRLLAEAAARGGPVWLVVDGLDEAEPPPLGANPLLLPSVMPDGVFAVVTRRDGELRTSPGTPRLGIRLTRDDREQTGDIEALLRDRAEHEASVARAIADARPAISVAEFVASMRQ